LNKLKKITVLDIILTLLFFCLIIFSISFFLLSNKNISKKLIVQTEKEIFYFYLDQKKEVKIKGESGFTTIKIDNGKFSFVDSPCKNKLCIHIGEVSISNFPIICLPNKVSGYIEDEKDTKDSFDGISR